MSMGRLIDADEVMKEVCRIMFEADTDIQKTDMQKVFKDIRNAIRNQPTAYDVDGVVEQLEKCLTDNNDRYMNHQIGTEEAIDREVCYTTAIDYVEAGGVQNDDCIKELNNRSVKLLETICEKKCMDWLTKKEVE